MSIIYLKGTFVEESEAKLSPSSRGLLFGDGCFETMKVYKGKLFALSAHYDRLKSTAQFLKIDLPFNTGALKKIVEELIELNSLANQDSRIRLTLIRGEGSTGLVPEIDAMADVLISVNSVSGKIEKMKSEGIKLSIINNIKIDERSPLVAHKTINYLPAILGFMEVKDKGGDEGLFLNYEGKIAEGTMSNIFIVKDGFIMTPPLSAGILPGITRSVVIKVAEKLGYVVKEIDLITDSLLKAEEIFITSSIREVVPVMFFEGISFKVGDVTKALQEGYKIFVDDSFIANS